MYHGVEINLGDTLQLPNLLFSPQSISKSLGTGNVMNISREEALLLPEITQRIFDIISVNLRMEATWIKEGAKFEWTSEVTLYCPGVGAPKVLLDPSTTPHNCN